MTGRGGHHRLLHHVLDPRQLLLYGSGGVHAACLLGQLQHRHVAQRTDLPHLQPLDEAPGTQAERRDDGDSLTSDGKDASTIRFTAALSFCPLEGSVL